MKKTLTKKMAKAARLTKEERAQQEFAQNVKDKNVGDWWHCECKNSGGGKANPDCPQCFGSGKAKSYPPFCPKCEERFGFVTMGNAGSPYPKLCECQLRRFAVLHSTKTKKKVDAAHERTVNALVFFLEVKNGAEIQPKRHRISAKMRREQSQ